MKNYYILSMYYITKADLLLQTGQHDGYVMFVYNQSLGSSNITYFSHKSITYRLIFEAYHNKKKAPWLIEYLIL